jgi:hypothetical protein
MAYKLKQKKGRPREDYKIRNVEGITPSGFKFERIEGKKIIYKRKGIKRENAT